MRERLVSGWIDETMEQMKARQKLGLPLGTYSYTAVWDDEPEEKPVDAGYRKFKDKKEAK